MLKQKRQPSNHRALFVLVVGLIGMISLVLMAMASPSIVKEPYPVGTCLMTKHTAEVFNEVSAWKSMKFTIPEDQTVFVDILAFSRHYYVHDHELYYGVSIDNGAKGGFIRSSDLVPC